jgi:K+-transporting ATPase ATPase A chain
VLRPFERLIYKLSGVNADEEMNWREYAFAMLGFSAVSMLLTYAIERLQASALEPAGTGRRGPRSGLEHRRQLYHQHQLAVVYARDHHELSHPDGGPRDAQLLVGGVGIAVAVALIRGIKRTTSGTIGNFWVDMTRTICSTCSAGFDHLCAAAGGQGVPQNLHAYTPRRIRWNSHADADHRAGPGGFAGSHQDAGHQRRRILQRQQRPSL